MSTTSVGRGGEARAEAYLAERGYRLLRKNYRSGPREIDLIMRDGKSTVFIEVRYRRSAAFGGAAASVTHSKQCKVLQAARLWLARHNGSFDTVDCRFDVLAFTGNDVEWFKDAFNDRS